MSVQLNLLILCIILKADGKAQQPAIALLAESTDINGSYAEDPSPFWKRPAVRGSGSINRIQPRRLILRSNNYSGEVGAWVTNTTYIASSSSNATADVDASAQPEDATEDDAKEIIYGRANSNAYHVSGSKAVGASGNTMRAEVYNTFGSSSAWSSSVDSPASVGHETAKWEIHRRHMHATTRRRRPPSSVRPSGRTTYPSEHDGMSPFWRLVYNPEFFDWLTFFVSVGVFLIINNFLNRWPPHTMLHIKSFFAYMLMGVVYNMAVLFRWDQEKALLWLDGFILELIFSLENVFIFHAIVEAFKTPTRAVQKALFVVVVFQNLYDLVLYMGFAKLLDSLTFLPYLLGVWLIYVGLHATNDSHSEITDINEIPPVRWCRSIFGSRLALSYNEDDPLVVFQGTEKESDRISISLLGLVMICLLIADFILEIDVTLTKIESLQDEFVSFTSSAVASFAMPPLYFLARDLFDRFPMLKYGIAFVLIFFGVQMLCCSFFRLSPLEGCGIILFVMMGCILMSPLAANPKMSKMQHLEAKSATFTTN